MLARLKPYNPRRGYTLRTYSAPDMPVFKVDKGWYEITDDQAEVLEQVRQSDSPEAPYAFDIVKDAEAAQAIEKAERRSTATAADPDAPHRMHIVSRGAAASAGARAVASTGTLTTADLPKADTTDALPGTESDLDSDDLAAAPTPSTPPPAGIPGSPSQRPPRRGR